MFVWLSVVVVVFPAGQFITVGQVMTGQPIKVSVNSTEVLTAARFAVKEFNKANTEERFAYKILNITSAKVQIVAGVNYILEMQLGRTVCGRSEAADGEPCALHSEPKCVEKKVDKRLKEDM